MSKAELAKEYLAKSSPRFRETYGALDRAIRGLFPEAEAVFAFGMPGWKIARRRWIDPKSVKGTLDPNWVQIYFVERKSGITLHLWNPADFNGMRRHDKELARVGLKVMVGCMQFNRKGDYPIDVVKSLLEDVRRSLETDAKSPGSAPH